MDSSCSIATQPGDLLLRCSRRDGTAVCNRGPTGSPYVRLPGADFVARRVAIGYLTQDIRKNAVVLAAIGLFLVTSFEVPKKISYGFKETAKDLASRPDFENSLIMVSSNTNLGEGIFLSEVAMAGRHNPAVMLRASKVLADNDWNDVHYHTRYETPGVLAACLEKIRVRYLILDVSPPRTRSYPHHEELTRIVNDSGAEWKLSASFAGDEEKRMVRIYRSQEAGNGGRLIAPSDVFSTTDLDIHHWPLLLNLNCQGASSNARPVKP